MKDNNQKNNAGWINQVYRVSSQDAKFLAKNAELDIKYLQKRYDEKKYATPSYYGKEHFGCWCERTGNSILENE